MVYFNSNRYKIKEKNLHVDQLPKHVGVIKLIKKKPSLSRRQEAFSFYENNKEEWLNKIRKMKNIKK